MNEPDDLMDDFASYIEARARKKSEETLAKARAAKSVLTEEQNMFNATVGLRIKCGVCGSMHKSSRVDILPGLKTCMNKLVETFSREQRRSYAHDKLFPEWTDENAALKLRETIVNALDAMVPSNLIWTATHAKFLKKVAAVHDRIDETCVREIVADVPMSEILGASNSVEYVRVKLKAFRDRMVEEQKESEARQLEMAGTIGKDLAKWRSIPIEKWAVTEGSKIHDYDNNEAVAEPLQSVVINSQRIDHPSLFGCFTTISTDSILWQARPKEIERYIIDVGLWKDQMPALLWSARTQQGYKRTRRYRSIRHGKPINGLNFLSRWNGKVYLIHGWPRTVKQIVERPDRFCMNEIVPRKDDKDLDS